MATREPRFAWYLTAKDNCPDCVRRSGMKERTWAAWARIGLPGSGFSVCEKYCKCWLLTTEMAAEGLANLPDFDVDDYLPENYADLSNREKAEARRQAAIEIRKLTAKAFLEYERGEG